MKNNTAKGLEKDFEHKQFEMSWFSYLMETIEQP